MTPEGVEDVQALLAGGVFAHTLKVRGMRPGGHWGRWWRL